MGAIIDRSQQFEFNKKTTIGGVDYLPGMPCDLNALDIPDHKVSQFLNQRIIRPAGTAPATGSPATDSTDSK